MPSYVVLLRGVNVGKANRLPMARFRELLVGLGYTDVVTLLNSGNAVFHSSSNAPKKLAADIAAALSRELGVDVHVIVKSAKEISAIVDANPIPAEPALHSRFLVAFTQDAKALAELAAVKSRIAAPEKFALGKDAAYLFCAKGILDSEAAKALLGKDGRGATTRNLATTLKLHALAKR